MAKSCCVPFCNELFKSKFGIPKDNNLKIVWEKSLNLKLNPSSRVCENHFDKNDVIRTWESGKGFSKYTICLKIPKLKPGAIPKLTVVNEIKEVVPNSEVLNTSTPIFNRGFCRWISYLFHALSNVNNSLIMV
ncbi:uncharacterized protein LOC126550733 [Aphis gossypii]|uniref:uncharacterized protein LOC126550733 n=1 Tax=Aphis gossypii TaxID=80765 RepID=UPI0021590AF8|nr:uncharacterized protein LOC126550733 [Aphis gossypii]